MCIAYYNRRYTVGRLLNRIRPLLLLLCATTCGVSAQRIDQARTLGRSGTIHPSSPTYIENRGQWDVDARFLVRHPGFHTWITDEGVLYDLHRFGAADDAGQRSRSGQVVLMRFVGAEPGATLKGGVPIEGRLNFLLGEDRSRWATDVRRYEQVCAAGLYDGIDALYYLDEGYPRYDLVVAPGADPGQIRIEFEGADEVRVDSDGTLRLATALGDIEQRGLFAYQEFGDQRRAVSCAFAMQDDGTIGFDLGPYDPNRPLIVDPVVYASLFGSSGTDVGEDIAVDRNGDIYVVGQTDLDQVIRFPTTTGAYDTTVAGTTDVVVLKVDPFKGGPAQLEYATYIGGSGEEQGLGIAVGSTGLITITGYTEADASNFPTTAGAFDVTHNGGNDVFVAQLDPNRSGAAQLIYSTFIGGSRDERAEDVAVDRDGAIYLTGTTFDGLVDYPTSPDAFDGTHNESDDAFVTKLDPGRTGANQLVYSTFLGGSKRVSVGNAIAVDNNGDIYVTGSTADRDFPFTRGAFDSLYGGGFLSDGFALKLSPSKTGADQLVYSTFLGAGEEMDAGDAIAVDGRGWMYVTGFTRDSAFHTTRGAFDTIFGGTQNAFVSVIDPGAPTKQQLRFSSLLGGDLDRTRGMGIDVDRHGMIYVVGHTNDTNFMATSNGEDKTYNGGDDLFISKINPTAGTGDQLNYSTFLGNDGAQVAGSAVIDRTLHVFATGTSSNGFPTTPGAFDTGQVGGADLFVTKFAIPTLNLVYPAGADLICAGDTINIEWGSLLIENVKIELTIDSGRTWRAIDTVEANLGQVEWIVPNTPSVRSRMRISSLEIPGIRDEGKGYFTIGRIIVSQHPQNRSVIVNRPVSFTAAAVDTPSATLVWQRSVDSGKSWQNIDTATESTLSFIAAIEDNGNLYRAVYNNGACNVPTDPASLEVLGRIRMITPNGGEEFCAGSRVRLEWDSDGISGVDIDLSLNGGGSWDSVAHGVPTDSGLGGYTWRVPESASNQVLLRLTDSANSKTADRNDGVFEIIYIDVDTSGPVTTKVPLGQTATFTASAARFASVQWQRSRNGVSWVDVPGATSESYSKVAEVEDDGDLYRAIYTDRECADTTRSAELQVIGSIQLTYPTGGDTVCAGALETVRWNSFAVENVRVLYSGNGGEDWEILESSVPSSGTYAWYVPYELTTEGRIRLESVRDTGVGDESSSDIAIEGVEVTEHPQTVDVDSGGTVVLTADAIGTPTPRVQWQVSTNRGQSFEDIPGATDRTYSFVATRSDSGNQYIAVFENGGCEVRSRVAIVTVEDLSSVGDGTGLASLLRARVLPNPITTTGAVVGISAPAGSRVGISVVDLLGRTVLPESTGVVPSTGDLRHPIDLGDLESGAYVVVVRWGDVVRTVAVRKGL